MRLSAREMEVIIQSFRKIFGESDRLWLFGSRVDDAARGGDIDLYVETDLTDYEVALLLKFAFLRAVMDKIGEQKIDVVLRLRDRPARTIDQAARSQGVQLV